MGGRTPCGRPPPDDRRSIVNVTAPVCSLGPLPTHCAAAPPDSVDADRARWALGMALMVTGMRWSLDPIGGAETLSEQIEETRLLRGIGDDCN